MRRFEFSPRAHDELKFWRANSTKTAERVLKLLLECAEHPERGSGKPEQLRFDLAGCWSRRIDKKNRLVYRFNDETVFVISLRNHY